MAPQDNALYGRLNHRIHIGDIQTLLRKHTADELMPVLVSLLQADNKRVADNAAWIMTHFSDSVLVQNRIALLSMKSLCMQTADTTLAFAADAFRADIYTAGPIGYRLSQPLSGRHGQSLCPCRHPRLVYETGMAAMPIAYGLASRNACASPFYGQGSRPVPCCCLCPQSHLGKA